MNKIIRWLRKKRNKRAFCKEVKAWHKKRQSKDYEEWMQLPHQISQHLQNIDSTLSELKYLLEELINKKCD